MTQEIRVRYAPSPTGLPHVGNIRTALFNWLFARANQGKFIVRIEDTDQARLVEGATEAILDSLDWLGLDWDEGPQVGGPKAPYVQSQRLSLYQAAAQKLIDENKAYYCFCTPQRLEQMREAQIEAKTPPGYDRCCRELDARQISDLEAQGLPKVIRFKCPTQGSTVFADAIRGPIEFDNALMDDFVILKSDGFPTYHLANVIDDADMQISHVLRAEEWISSTPKHILLYRAFGLEAQMPIFAHLPMILGPDKSKLSKRHGAVALTQYRDLGYLPEAMLNFLCLLGWAYDDKTEIFDTADLIKNFGLNKVSKTAAIFNIDKLNWMNGIYLRRLPIDDLAKRMLPLLQNHLDLPNSVSIDIEYLTNIVPLVQERLKLLDVANVVDPVRFFFTENLNYTLSNLLSSKLNIEDTKKVLRLCFPFLSELPTFTDDNLVATLKPLQEESGLKPAAFLGALRWAV